jgi:hypothetical protein
MGYLVMVLSGFILIGIGVTGYIAENTIERTHYRHTVETVFKYFDRNGKPKELGDIKVSEIIKDYVRKEVKKKPKKK